jgi:hypothetical protein
MTSKSRNVELVGHSDLGGHGDGGQVVVQRRGDYYFAFIGHMKDMGTSIVDVTDPKKPSIVTQIPIDQNTHSHKVRVCGDIMLVNNEQYGVRKPFDAGLRVYNISDPSKPKELSFFETGGRGVHRFWLDCEKSLAYISTEANGYLGAIFMTVDISDPKKPDEVSRWWIPGQWTDGGEEPPWDAEKENYRHHHPVVLGDRAYLGYWDAGYIILDISEIRQPRMISRADYSPPYGGAFHTALPVRRKIMDRRWLIVFQESTAPYHMEGKKLMWVVDVTVETNPVPVATFQVPNGEFTASEVRFGPHQPYEDVDIRDDLIYAAWFSAGLRVISIANPYRPEEVGYFVPSTPNLQKAIQTNDVYVDDRELVYIIDRLNGGLDILRYTDPHARKK